MFNGFESFDIETEGAVIHGVIGGEGPPLLLLHGNPQTHVMWHRIAPALAKSFTVVACDLRGYGRSSKPPSTRNHAPYSKRAMATDMVQVMEKLEHSHFMIGAHDRGARVAHRLALDWPDNVLRMALLDIAPTREMYRDATSGFAREYWHWYFMIQPPPMPERMMTADPERFWRWKCDPRGNGLSHFSTEALADYLETFTEETIRATCEDYRAAASIDIRHDDDDDGRKVDCPILVLWGEKGAIERHFDCLALWRERVSDVSGWPLPGGHYLAEELPDDVLRAFMDFFDGAGGGNRTRVISLEG